MIPVQYEITGDKARGEVLTGFGLGQLGILLNQMALPGLDEGVRHINPFDGVEITCTSSYGTNVVSIHVEPEIVPVEKPVPREEIIEFIEPVEPEYEYPKDISYFVRIKYPDPEPYPKDLDGWGGAIHDDLRMDRIIVWDMRFDFKESELADPENEINRYNGFVPGAGVVKYDVDVVNEVVYFPLNLTEDEEISLILRAKAHANIIPTNAEPDKGLSNKAKDWFYSGHLANPAKAAIASYSSPPSFPPNGSTIKLNESIIGFYCEMDPPPDFMEYEYHALSAAGRVDVLDEWRFVWSPAHGGDPDRLITLYDWVGFGDVVDYYGTYNIPCSTGVNDLVVMSNTEVWLNGDYLYTATIAANFKGAEIGIKGGFYFTSTEPEGVNTFFVTQKSSYFGSEEVWVEMRLHCGGHGANPTCPYDIGTPPAIGSVMVAATPEEPGDVATIHVRDASPGIIEIITPLETIPKADYRSSYSEATGECTEFAGTVWANYDAVSALVRSPSPDYFSDSRSAIYQNFRDYYGPDNISGDYNITPNQELAPWFRKAAVSGIDTHYLCDVFAVNNVEVRTEYELIKNSKYFSLFYFDEKKTKYQSSVYYGDAYCNGVNYGNWEDAPPGKFGSTGCVIYIFAPKTFVNYDEQGNVASYWDIHSARRDESVINPYRCLDLEEYVMDVVQEIQQNLDDTDSIAKLDGVGDSIGATLNYYGYGITNGFFYSGISVVEVTGAYADN